MRYKVLDTAFVCMRAASKCAACGIHKQNLCMGSPSRLVLITRLPEFNVVLFALLLNYPWEFLQVPLFEGMPQAEHWDAIRTCTRATLGDAVIMLIAHWVVCLAVHSRSWVLAPSTARILIFSGTGVLITIVIERLALAGSWLGGWRYSSLMPVVPGIEVGLSPLLQWVVLPPLVAWFSRRQILGAHG